MPHSIWCILRKKTARFDFDFRFPKMPSYLRRAAIRHALGSVSSYKTRMDLWTKSGEKTGMPKLVYENHAMPVFYRGVMYREGAEGKEEAYLKLYDGHDWKWFCVRLNHTDMEYLSWEENLSIIPVKKTGCTAHWDGSGDSRESTALRSHGEDGHIRNV